MPYAYMQRGDYYRGDYYRGDPGIFSSIGKALGGVAKFVTGTVAPALIPGPVGGIVGAASRGIFGGKPKGTALVPSASLPSLQLPTGGSFGGIRIGGSKGFQAGIERYQTTGGRVYTDTDGNVMVAPKRRRMNPANPKALRRALRRVSGFGKLAKRARRDIGRAASAVGARRTVHHGGSRGVITRSEAAKALRG